MSDHLRLQGWQINHYRRILEIIKRWFIWLDKSPTGSGKTFVTLAIAKSCGFQLLIVCPVIMESKWRELAELYNIPIVDIISFHRLAGRSSKVDHPYLIKAEEGYEATLEYKELLQTPTLLVVDEAHLVKNVDSLRSEAVHGLIKELIKHPNCRAGLLSATPFDKESHADSLLRMLGLETQEGYYYNPHTRFFGLTGMKRAFNICCRWDPEIRRTPIPARKADYDSFCYRLLNRVVLPRLSSRMPAPVLEYKHDIANGFYVIEPENISYLIEAKCRMQRGLRGGADADGNVFGYVDWSEITMALMMLEKAKVGIMSRLARKALLENPSCKVILAANYLETITTLEETLREFCPKTMIGSTSKEHRRQIVNTFQEPNLKSRLLIVNPTVGGMGIDLDDTHGGFPRWLFVMPSFRSLEIMQMLGRIYRSLTKSEPHSRLIYVLTYDEENRILSNLAKKSKILKEILDDCNEEMLFPGEYPKFKEIP